MRNSCISLFKKEKEEKLYRQYITESLRIITENTASMSGGQYISVKWNDIIEIEPRKNNKEGEGKRRILNKLRS